ncbi:hypothetical protein GQ55_2G231100 [Panicum hallii var. hallii]|uniref:Uncharacterized protein n=1 Tax=Panicum hallii var. hallii TaxID=1504633 RepID=A0A2T7ERI9_9POAL|nr:hypothetical protein GQ55_2G231100 [Panicum hallii var. hallii]
MLVRLGRRRRRHRVAVDAPVPRVVGVGPAVAERAPHVAARLEPRPERQHPEPVAGADPALRLEVGQLVEHQAARRVPEPVQRRPRRLHHRRPEPHQPRHRVDHRLPARVDAHVLERALEVGHLRRRRLAIPRRVRARHAPRVPGHLRRGKHPGPQRGDVPPERGPRDADQVLGERHALVAPLVLHLRRRVEGRVVGAVVRPQRAHQLVLGVGAAGGDVRHQRRRGAHAEDAVGHQHVLVLAEVPVEAGVLRHHHQRVPGPPLAPQRPRRRVDAHGAGAAPHPGDAVRLHVGPHLEAVRDHGRQRRHRGEHGARHDEDADVGGRHVGLGQELPHHGEQALLGLLHRERQCLLEPAREDEGRREGLLPQPGLAVDEAHEVGDVVGVAPALEAEVLAHLQVHLPVHVREVAAVVQQVHRALPPQDAPEDGHQEGERRDDEGHQHREREGAQRRHGRRRRRRGRARRRHDRRAELSQLLGELEAAECTVEC